MHFQPSTDNYKKKVEESFNRQKFMAFINAKLMDVQTWLLRNPYSIRSQFNPATWFFFMLALSAPSQTMQPVMRVFSLMDENSSVLTVEFKLNLISPGNGDLLIGRANVLKKRKNFDNLSGRGFFCQRWGGKTLCCFTGNSDRIEK